MMCPKMQDLAYHRHMSDQERCLEIEGEMQTSRSSQKCRKGYRNFTGSSLVPYEELSNWSGLNHMSQMCQARRSVCRSGSRPIPAEEYSFAWPSFSSISMDFSPQVKFIIHSHSHMLCPAFGCEMPVADCSG